MTDNTDEPFSIVIDKSNYFSFSSYTRSDHVYMNIWNPVDGEILLCKRETKNSHDNNTVSIMHNSYGRPCSSEFEQTFFKFIFAAWSTILCIITGKKRNHGVRLGLGIHIIYQAEKAGQ